MIACNANQTSLQAPTTPAAVQFRITDEQASKVFALSPAGMGPIKLGMTIDEAENASSLDLAINSERQTQTCTYVESVNGFDEEVNFLTVDNRIVRIAVVRPSYGESILATDRGIGIGSSHSDVQAAYPEAEVTSESGYSFTLRSTSKSASQAKLSIATDGVEVTGIEVEEILQTNLISKCNYTFKRTL